MKRSKDFILSKIAGNQVLVPIGSKTVDFDKIVSLNELGVFIWEKLENDMTLKSLAEAVMAEYDVGYETAAADIEKFVSVLRENGCVTD